MKDQPPIIVSPGQRHRFTRAGHRRIVTLLHDARGAVLVEVALSLPILIFLILGVIFYGAWLTAANAVQQAANEAARAALSGLSAGERQTLAAESVTHSVTGTGVLDPTLITVTTSQNGSFYSVSVTYDARRSPLFSASPIPLPNGQIRRASVVKLVSL